jgi:hypothetical protein
MRAPYTRFYLLKKRNIFVQGLEPAELIVTTDENSVLARAAFATCRASHPCPLTSLRTDLPVVGRSAKDGHAAVALVST